jgi:hypothetical protein
MRCSSPSPRPAAFPPPSPPPMLLGIVRGFTGTMQPSDSSSACMPIVRLWPSWAGPAFRPDADEVSQVPCKGRLHVRGVSDSARLLVRKPFARRGCRLLFSRTRSAPRNSTRFAAQYPARGIPCERFKLSLAASPCITRGRGGWLGLTPWKTCTSYPLPAFLAHSASGQHHASQARLLDGASHIRSGKSRNGGGTWQVSTRFTPVGAP